jgi:peptide deformylase
VADEQVEQLDEETVESEEEGLDDEARARRALALAQIRQYGDPVLRLRANEVTQFDEHLARLAARMTTLMEDARGVGLAGNQVGILQRIFIFRDGEDDPGRAVVNPRIVERGDELDTAEEGCLSLQGVRAPVERNVSVVLEGNDVEGGELRLELTGLPARVVQHELDHLDGILILDRTTPESRREALGILRPRPVLGALQ